MPQHQTPLFKLQGDWNDVDSWMLFEEEQLARENEFNEFLRSILDERVILFLGVSISGGWLRKYLKNEWAGRKENSKASSEASFSR